MNWLKKVLEKIGKFILKEWKLIGILGGAIIAGIIIKKTIVKIVDKIKKPVDFLRDPYDSHIILVPSKNSDKTWDKIRLPKNIRNTEVIAAGHGKTESEIIIEIKHKVVNRRG